jgi:hypothetical protein
MLIFSLEDPSTDKSYSRTLIPVRYGGQRQGYASFRNGRYEFAVGADVHQALTNGTLRAEFECRERRPIAIDLTEQVEHPGTSTSETPV